MEYTEMSIFSEQSEEDFIILPSQTETEQESQSEEQLNEMVRKLPALQRPILSSDEEEDHITITHIKTNYDEGGSENPLVINSDKIDQSDPHALEDISISEKDVTVVDQILSEEKTETHNDKIEPNSSHSNKQSHEGQLEKEKNVMRKDITFISSQDDIFKEDDHVEDDRIVCTPAQHLGSLQLSQSPMLVPETVEDTLNEIPPSPGVYGSTPIIIPSSPTQDAENQTRSPDCNVNNSQISIQSKIDGNKENVNVIEENNKNDCSKNQYDAKQSGVINLEFADTLRSPFRNPVVKNMQSRENDNNDSIPSFDFNSGNTLSSYHLDEKNALGEADIVVVDNTDLQTTADTRVEKEPEQSESFGDNLLQPTLLDDDSSVCKKPETNTLCKAKKQSDSNSLPSLDIDGISRPDNGLDSHLPAPLSSQVLQGSLPIVIHDDTHLTQNEVTESQDFALHLSLTGSDVSGVSRSQSAHTEPFQLSDVKTVCEKKSDLDEDRLELSSEDHEHSVIRIDCDDVPIQCLTDSQVIIKSQSKAVVEPKVTESDPKCLNEEKGIDIENNNDRSDSNELEKDEVCDTNSKPNSTKPIERRSQSKSQEKSQSSGSDSMSHSEWKRARKRAIKMQAVNDNPPIEWKDESDAENQPNMDITTEVSSNRFSDEFHLVVPKAAAWSDTVTSVAMETNETESQMLCSKQLCAEQMFNRTSSQDDTLKLPMTTSSNGGHDKLMMEMMQLDTEVSQTVFKLERPQIEESNVQDESEVKLPNSSKSSPRRRQARFIIEDSDDDEVPSTDNKVPAVCSSQSEETDKVPGGCPSQSEGTGKEENMEVLVATKLDTTVITDVEMGDKPNNISIETDCGESKEIQPVVSNKDKGHGTLIDSESGDKEKPGDYSDKAGACEEVLVTENIAVESSEMTQTYDPNVAMETKDDESSKKDAIENSSESRLIEHSTQTNEDKQADELERMALNVTQRVVEYLQSGCSPRSRSSSTCTDNSDTYKTPNSKKREGTKSPKELQDVLKTYSDILNKKHRSRNKSGSDKKCPNSQHPNLAADDTVKTSKESLRRRLSTQSLPPNSAENNTNVLKRQFSHSVGAQNANKMPGKKAYRHSVDNYYFGKALDELNTSKKNIPTDIYPITEKTDQGSEASGKIPVKQHDSKSNIHTVDVCNSIASPDQPNKRSVCDNENVPVQRTRLKSKSDISLSAEDKGWLTANRVESIEKTPGKVKRCVSSEHTVKAVLDKTKEKHTVGASEANTSVYSESVKSKRSVDAKKEDIHIAGKSLNPRTVSGSFVSTTQTFPVNKGASLSHEIKDDDPYQFHGSESQIDEVIKSVKPRSTPPRKHLKLHLTEAMLQKSDDELEIIDKDMNKQEDNRNMMTSQTSIVTATTIGSSPHLPTSSSQSNAGRENILSQKSSSSECSVSANYRAKSQLKQSMVDVLPNANRMVTVITETIERVFTEITTVRKVIGPEGNIIEKSEKVLRLDPVIMKEKTTKDYYPPSSFDVDVGTTLTSNVPPVESQSPPSKLDELTTVHTASSESNSDSRLESPYQDQSVSSSHSSDVSMVTSDGTIGSRVLSMWKDGYYYPGCLKSSADRYSKYQILFDDGDSLMVKSSDILLIERLPVGQSVMVLSEGGIFEYGIISSLQSDTYTVETDDGKSGKYAFSKVILSSDQAFCILSDNGSKVTMQCHATSAGLPVNYGDVSLENLIDAPRRSKKPARENIKHDSPRSNERSRKRKLDMIEPQTSSTPKPDRTSHSPVGKKRRVMDGIVHGLQASPLTVKKSSNKTRTGLFRKQLGPIPTKKLFKNMHFLLTNVDKSKELLQQERQLLHDSSFDTSDDSAVDEEMISPFDKDHLKSQITAGGGTVIETLDEKLLSNGNVRIVLVSSGYQRTYKYLQCLAYGIPCMSHMWIVDSCNQGTLLDDKSYILPAGVSLEKRKVMEWKKKKDIFQGIKAAVYSRDKQFVEYWSHILSLGKCTLHKQLQYTDVNVIVTDNFCTSAMERQASSKGIPLVSSEWVIQSLINGRLVSYTGNLKYRHDSYLTKEDFS